MLGLLSFSFIKEKLPDEFHVHHPSTRLTSRLRSCHLGIFGRETLFFIVIYELEISFLHFIPIYLPRCVCVRMRSGDSRRKEKFASANKSRKFMDQTCFLLHITKEKLCVYLLIG